MQNISISKKIKELREQAGLSPRDLATRSGLSPAYISKLESGEYETFSLKTLKQLSEGLKLTLKTLLESLGFINNDQKQNLGEEMIACSFRSNGYTAKEADKIMEYAKFIKGQTDKK